MGYALLILLFLQGVLAYNTYKIDVRLAAYESNRLGCIISKSELEELGFCKKGDKKCK